MLSLIEFLSRAERRGELTFFLIGGRSLEAYGVIRFTKDVDLLVASPDIGTIAGLLQQTGYEKVAETSVFSRWKHPSMLVDDVDVMYVKPDTFAKLLSDSHTFTLPSTTVRVPSIPILISLKLHAIKSNPERLDKDGRDIAELLKLHPQVLTAPQLEALFAKYGCSDHFPQFRHLVS